MSRSLGDLGRKGTTRSQITPSTNLILRANGGRTWAQTVLQAEVHPERINALHRLLGSLAGHTRLEGTRRLVRAIQPTDTAIELLWTERPILPTLVPIGTQANCSSTWRPQACSPSRRPGTRHRLHEPARAQSQPGSPTPSTFVTSTSVSPYRTLRTSARRGRLVTYKSAVQSLDRDRY